jgi:XTP/dITP diphosphohydrolase
VTLVIATQNIHKVQEIKAILGEFIWGIKALPEIDKNLTITEDGTTFEDNAKKKAVFVMEKFGYITLGEDTGLVVDALNGRPGVYSARYAGEKSTYQQNVEKLLVELKDIPLSDRKARFRCVCALAFPKDFEVKIKIFEGVCEGHIIDKPTGSGGFGYDPIFVPVGYSKTFAELSSEEKNRISHRSKAIRQVKLYLTNLRI